MKYLFILLVLLLSAPSYSQCDRNIITEEVIIITKDNLTHYDVYKQFQIGDSVVIITNEEKVSYEICNFVKDSNYENYYFSQECESDTLHHHYIKLRLRKDSVLFINEVFGGVNKFYKLKNN